jgi:PAS domain S-box-containing protein
VTERLLILFNNESDLIHGERLLKRRRKATVRRLGLSMTDYTESAKIFRVRNLDGLRDWLRSSRHQSAPTFFLLALKTEFEIHRQAMASLASMNVRFSHLLSSGQDQIFVLDRDMRMVAFFGNWPKGAPWQLDQLLGRRKREILPPELTSVHEAAVMRALNGETATYEWSMPVLRRPVHLLTACSPLRNDGDAITGVLLVTRDVTALKKAQLQLQKALKDKRNQLLEVEDGVKQIAASLQRRARGVDEDSETSRLHTRAFLSDREASVLRLLRKGLRLRSIAQMLGISVETARRHVKAMFRKTGVHSQEELVRLFSQIDEEV